MISWMGKPPASRLLFWLAFFFGLFLLVFHRFWFHTIIASDAFNIFAPNKAALLRGLREGTVYAWNPWLFFGLPLVAMIEAGVYYPLNFLFLIFDFGLAHRLYILVHYPVASFFCFLLMRRLGSRSETSALAAVAFGLSGYMVSQHSLVQLMLGMSWAPLALYCALRTPEGWCWPLGAGAALAMQTLAGDPMTAAATAVVGGGLIAINPSSGRTLTRAGMIAAMGASAFLLSAAQALPTWELMKLSPRSGGLAYADMIDFSLHPAQLCDFFWPTPFGVSWPQYLYWGGFTLDHSFSNIPWSASNYLGLPVLALAGLGFVAGRKPLRWWLLGGAVLFLLLALGRYAPVYRLLAEVPVFNAFRYPSKYVAGLTLCLALAAGLGGERFLDYLAEKPELVARAGRAYLGIAAALAAAGLLVWPLLLEAHAPAAWERAGFMGAARAHLVSSWLHWTAVNLIFGAGMLVAGKKRLSPAVVSAGAGVVIVFDLYLANVTIMPSGPEDIFDHEPAAAAAIRADGEPLGRGRVFREEWDYRDRDPALRDLPRYARQAAWWRQTLRRNHSAMSGIEDAVLYGAYEIKDGLELFEGGIAPQTLALYNVRYYIGPSGSQPFRSVEVETIIDDPVTDFRIDRLKRVWPRAYFVPGAQAARDEAEAIKMLRTVDLTRETIITGKTEVASAPPEAEGIRAARVMEYTPDRVRVEVEAPASGWLALNDRFYPGWRATVDGTPVEIFRANVLVRAVKVGPGRHTVEFTFRPVLVRVGVWISGLAWLALAGAFITRRKSS